MNSLPVSMTMDYLPNTLLGELENIYKPEKIMNCYSIKEIYMVRTTSNNKIEYGNHLKEKNIEKQLVEFHEDNYLELLENSLVEELEIIKSKKIYPKY